MDLINLKYDTKSYTIKDYYLNYLNYIEAGTKYEVSYETFRDIVKDYFEYIRDNVLEKSMTAKLPCRLGQLSIIKHQPKNYNSKSLRVDFQATKLYGKTIYHLNEHSNGYKYRFLWSKKDILLPHKAHYQFIACRGLKRKLAEYIKNKVHDYTPI